MEVELKMPSVAAMPDLQKEIATPSSEEILSRLRNDSNDEESARTPSQAPQQPTSMRGSFLTFLKTKAHQLSNFFASHSNNWWLFEVFAATISVLAMLTLIGVLHVYNGRVVQRLHLGITLNGLVAALSTICRTALMIPVTAGIGQAKWHWFSPKAGKRHPESRLRDLEIFDSASRGTWGSVKLLWRLRARRLVSVGALITILVLVFDTFTQQVLTTEFKPVVSDTDPNALPQVPRSEYYNISIASREWGAIGPDWPSISAVYNGMFSNNTSPISASCQPGNCTWPLIPSLAVCSSCKPISWNTTGAQCDIASQPTCNYTLPDGQIVIVDGSVDSTMFQVLSTSTVGLPGWRTTPYIYSFEALGMPTDSDSWSNSKVSAQQCTFSYCLQTYNVTVVNNIQNQTVVETWNEIYDQTVGNTGFNLTFSNIPLQSMNVAPDTNYTVDMASQTAAAALLGKFFNGTAQARQAPGGIWYDTDYVQDIWLHWDDLSALVSNVALAMTNNIRETRPAPTEARYTGTGTQDELFVVVRWQWLSLPAALVLLSIFFLVSEMLQTWKDHIRVWKNNSLALLFCGVDARIKQAARGGLDRPAGLDDETTGLQALLTEEDGFWEFRSGDSTASE